MDIRVSRVHAEHSDARREISFRIGPGQHVDIDQSLGSGVYVRDVFPEEFFESDEEPAEAHEE